MWRGLLRPASVVVVAAFVFAGCGEDGESASSGAQGAAQASVPSTTVTTLAATTTVTPTTAAATRCANLTLAGPEDTATDIRSTGLGCTEAESLVRKVAPRFTSSTGPPRVEAEGFTCNRTSVRSGDHGPPLGTIDCSNGAARVVFLRALVN